MPRIAFSTFLTNVRNDAFPEGESENLVANHTRQVKEALIDLQQKVPCLQENHIDYVPHSATYFMCGASVFDAPRGMLRKLSTITCADPCDRVVYDPVSKDRIDCLIEEQNACETIEHPYQMYYDGAVYFDYPTIPVLGFEYPGGDIDLPCRAPHGYWTKYREQIWIHPSLRSDEIVELEWDGVKREWENTDTLDDDEEVHQAVVLWLIGWAALREDCDRQKADMFFNEDINRPGLYQQKRGDLIWQCREERRLPKPLQCPN